MARASTRGIKQPHPLGSVARGIGAQQLTASTFSGSSGIKISALPAASAANGTDQLEVNQSGTSRSVTLSQILASGSIFSMADGTAPSPGLAFASAPSTGIFKSASASAGATTAWGLSLDGVAGLHVRRWTVAGAAGALDGTLFNIGRPLTWTTNGGEAYIATILSADQTMTTFGRGMVGMNIGPGVVTLGTSGTYTDPLVGVELDKTEVGAAGGVTATVNRPVGFRVRGPVITANVTAAEATWLQLAINNDEGGTVTKTALVAFPALHVGHHPSQYYGLLFKGPYSTGGGYHIGSDTNVPLTLFGGGGITATTFGGYDLTLTSGNNLILSSSATEDIYLKLGNTRALIVQDNLTTEFLRLQNNGGPVFTAYNPGAIMRFSVKGSGYQFFCEANLTSELVRINSIASSVNYLNVTPAATGGPVTLGAGSGTDANVDLALLPQGTGVLRYGTYTATPSAVAGYITIKDSGGTTRKLAVIS